MNPLFLSLRSLLLAAIASHATKIPRRYVESTDIKQLWNYSAQSNRLNSPPNPLPQTPHPDIRIIHYSVPESNVELDFMLFLRNPIEDNALGTALYTGIQEIRARLNVHGDDWLAPRDDPYLSTVPEKCVVRIGSEKTDSGRSKMTYKTLFAAFVGLWNRLYVEKEPWAVSFKIQVAGMVAGHGSIKVPVGG